MRQEEDGMVKLIEPAAATAALALVALPAAGGCQNRAIDIDPPKMEPGLRPQDFDSWRTSQGGPAKWGVVQDATATNGRATRQTSTHRMREELTGEDIEVSANEWHISALRAEDDRFTATSDFERHYTARDETFADAGKVALCTRV
jgi:hypothetical protein